MPAPDLSLETAAGGIVAGVDEAGRGPWAGPVVAGAVILGSSTPPKGINDSKALSPARRQSLFKALRADPAVSIGVGIADVEEIDRLNILAATMLAMDRAVGRLAIAPQTILVDGNRVPDFSIDCRAEAVVKGDARSLSIAAASIIAKVTRDRIMADLALKHPGYGWDRNAGYGTAEHRAAITELGITAIHRRSFAPIRNFLAQSNIVTA